MPQKQTENTTDLQLSLDRDTLHTLPLCDIPLKTPGLKNGVMIKNARLQSVIEIFRDASTGSGQVEIDNLQQIFPSYKDELDVDEAVLNKVGELESFDVYSLRIQLRKLNVDVNNTAALRLSDQKMLELADAMKRFTDPLVEKLYGVKREDHIDFSDIFRALNPEQRKRALDNMKEISKNMNFSIDELPEFIEDCGDLYLSIAYYNNALSGLMPTIKDFLTWVEEIKKSGQFRQDRDNKKLIKQMEYNLKTIIRSTRKRLDFFQDSFINLWDDINIESYQELRQRLISSHAHIGAILCGLTVKMNRFNEKFSNRGGSLRNRMQFIRREMSVGLDELAKREKGI